MPTIESVHVAENLTAMWGINAYEYKIEDAANTNRKVQVDFQDLMVAISERRATTVEGEIVPLSTRIRDRNATLDKSGRPSRNSPRPRPRSRATPPATTNPPTPSPTRRRRP